MRVLVACALLLMAGAVQADVLPGTRVVVRRIDGSVTTGATGAANEHSIVVHRDSGGFEVLQLSEFKIRPSSDGALHLHEDVISAPNAIDAIGATLVVSTAGLHVDGRTFEKLVVLDPVLAYDGALWQREEMAGTQAHVREQAHASLAKLGFVASSAGTPAFATTPVETGIARLVPSATLACQETGASAAVLSRIVVRQTFEPDDPESDRKRLSRDRRRWCLNVAHVPLVCGSVLTFPFLCIPSELPTYDESVGLSYPKKEKYAPKHHEVIHGIFEVALVDSSGSILWERREASRDPWRPDASIVQAIGNHQVTSNRPRAPSPAAFPPSGGTVPPVTSGRRPIGVSLVSATLSAGAGDGFEYEGSQRYRAREQMAAIRVHGGAGPGIARGPALTAEASYAEHTLGSPRCVEDEDLLCDEPEPGYRSRSPRMGALRAGYHGTHAGLEAGAYGFGVEGDDVWSSGPSVTGWAGAAMLHAWIDVNAGDPRVPRPRRGTNEEPFGIGFGHASERARLRAGLTSSGTMFEADVRVWNALWIGAQVRGASEGQYAAALRLTIPFHSTR